MNSINELRSNSNQTVNRFSYDFQSQGQRGSLPDFADNPRMLFVHAHPDDESIFTGGTIAHYATLGAEILIVTCTLGEEGDVMPAELRWLLAHDGYDQMGGYRYTELRQAISALSASATIAIKHRFLGGPSRWRDSGMSWVQGNSGVATQAANIHPRAFIQGKYHSALYQQQLTELIQILDEFKPHYVITYDNTGIYGHPDHIHAHDLTCSALSVPLPSRWQVWWALEVVQEAHLVGSALQHIDAQTLPVGWSLADHHILVHVGSARAQIRIDVADSVEIQRQALTAHATQLQVHPEEKIFVFSNLVAFPFAGVESYNLLAKNAAYSARSIEDFFSSELTQFPDFHNFIQRNGSV